MVRTLTLRPALLAALLAAPAAAQLPNASAAAFGMSGSYTAVARGYDALAWNPAMLGLAGNGGFSFTFGNAGGTSVLSPLDLSTFKPYEGKLLPESVRREWLDRVTAAGGESGQADAGATFLAFSTGRIAFQLASSAYVTGNLSPDAFELVMFGNAGRSGQPGTFDLVGSHFRTSVFTTAATGLGIPIGSHLSVGLTAKYVTGNFFMAGRDDGTSMTPNSVTVRFPTVFTVIDSGVTPGKGYALDVGLAWRAGALTVGASLQNAMNTFRWDSTFFRSSLGRAYVDADTTYDEMDDTTYALAPVALRKLVAEDRFKPVVSIGVAFRPSPILTLAADVRQELAKLEERIGVTEDTRMSGGLEFRGIPFLPLRLGASSGTEGWAASAGTGLRLGRFEIGLSGMMRNRSQGRETGVMLGLFSIN